MREWLTARPIAHRGLHDAPSGVIENTPSAFRAAIAGGYGIECDLQISADGEAMVHHDDALGCLTEGAGSAHTITAEALQRIAFKSTADRMLTLGELAPRCRAHDAGDRVEGRLCWRCEARGTRAAVLANYRGPVAAMSFDPA
jgi:glycerophosphoryl diester phosphodiesterase